MNMAKKSSLGSALVIILVSSLACVALTVTATIVTGEKLYLFASGLFVISGLAGVYVVRNLSKKMGDR
jgi:hypothetical protein